MKSTSLFYDAEVYINTRIYYSIEKGYPATHEEPGEPDSVEIHNIEAQEKITKEEDDLKTYVLKHHPLPPDIVRLIINQNTLDDETHKAAEEEAQAAEEYKADQKYNELKDEGYYENITNRHNNRKSS